MSVEPYWPGLFAKLFEKKSIADLITNVGAGKSPSTFTSILSQGQHCVVPSMLESNKWPVPDSTPNQMDLNGAIKTAVLS